MEINKLENRETRKILFKHNRLLGDEVMATAGIRDFSLLFPNIKINFKGNYPAIWENNPYLDPSIKEGDEGVEVYKIGYPAIGSANNTYIHFSQMFLLDMLAVVDQDKSLGMSLGEFCSTFSNGRCGDPALSDTIKNSEAREPFISLQEKYQGFCKKYSRMRGDLHLTEQEKSANIVKDLYGYEKYVVVAPGGRYDCTCKIWDWRKFQKVIDYFDGLIKFVVIGKSDLIINKLNNTIDLIDKFNNNLRGLFSLIYNADLCVSGPSALMHIAAAMPPKEKITQKPCVVLLGSREPLGWIDYTGHQTLHTNGVFDCGTPACWKARIISLPKDPKHNKNLCKQPIIDDGITVPSCMASITSQDVIRAIEKYYDGNLYTYLKRKEIKKSPEVEIIKREGKEINLLGNLNSAGGGEQSLCTIAKLLEKSGWKVNLYPMGSVHQNYKNLDLNIMEHNFSNGMRSSMKDGLPLLFYANDSTRKFVEEGQEIVDKSSDVIIGINYINKPIPNCAWLSQSKKVKGIIFQNKEKLNEFKRDQIGFEDTKLINLYGAIDLNKFLEVCPAERKDSKDKLIILKHCCADYRKYVTKESENKGDKVHIWQKKLAKDVDTKFYSRLLKEIDNVEFRFMAAHKELVEYFQHDNRMKFYSFDEISVTEFLKQGHIYLYRTSNLWRDNLPRGMIEAMAVGLPIIGEPRDGPYDRIIHGENGMYACHYDEFKLHIKTLQRKEDMRREMGQFGKQYAKNHYNPKEWVSVIEELL